MAGDLQSRRAVAVVVLAIVSGSLLLSVASGGSDGQGLAGSRVGILADGTPSETPTTSTPDSTSTTAAPSTRATVQVGSTGADVTYLQQRLTVLGFNPG